MNKELIKRTLSSIILIPAVLLLIIEGSLIFNLFLIICFLIAFYEWYKINKNIFIIITGFIYLVFSFYTIYKFISFNNSNIYFLFIISICVSTDIGGYTIGKILRGPKLTSLSPKKTISGMIGGYLFAILSSIIFLKTALLETKEININLSILIFVLLVSTISQLGDIFISYFKRLSKVKDTGKIIPGHGGLLDRIDGMIFAYPFSYLMLSTQIFNIF